MENFENREEKKDSLDNTIENLGDSIEISPSIEGELAICVIKPDAFTHRDAIVKRLEESGLYIVERRPVGLTESFVVKEMYGKDKLPKPLEDAHIRHFLSGKSEVVLVRGGNAVGKLLTTVGLKTNPALCEPDTIRYIYGSHIPEELEDGLKYYRNAAHRPTNEQEAEEDLNKFRKI